MPTTPDDPPTVELPHPALAPFHDPLNAAPVGPVGRLVRRAVRPWFAVQAEFNRAVIRVLDGYLRLADHRQRLADARLGEFQAHYGDRLDRVGADIARQGEFNARLEADARHAADSAAEGRAVLLARSAALEAGLADRLDRLEQAVAAAGLLPDGAALSLGALDLVFVQTRLPAGPARLWAAGLDDRDLRELAALGFAAGGGPAAVAVLRGPAADAPRALADAPLAAAARVILSVPGRVGAELLPGGFDCAEVVYAAREGAGYRFTRDAAHAEHTWVVGEKG